MQQCSHVSVPAEMTEKSLFGWHILKLHMLNLKRRANLTRAGHLGPFVICRELKNIYFHYEILIFGKMTLAHFSL